MNKTLPNLPALPGYMDKLHAHHKRLGEIHMRDMFARDEHRFENMSIKTDDLVFDFSKNLVDEEALETLIDAAKASRVEEMRDAMFAGEIINTTENRAVMHMALRNRSDKPVIVNGSNIMSDIRSELARMKDFAHAVRNGDYRVTEGQVTDVVNIGIGGSDLGPRMATRCLQEFNDGPKVHFVANVDASDLDDTLATVNPGSTLFIIASKSFKTSETILNAINAKQKIEEALGTDVNGHFCAVSANLEATRSFGIADERTFGLWDWVGGRYSVWSAVGLSLLIAIGPADFDKFLDGASYADNHFNEAPLRQNIPVIMALLGIWYRNVCGYPVHAILPYDSRMSHFPEWLQQLDMESNGKSILKSDNKTVLDTGLVVFGEVGTNGQHAFYQMIHQGTTVIPCDFLIAATGQGAVENRQILLANCLAQSEALMTGRTLEEAGGDPHRAFEGNRPSNTFLYKKMTPHTLGMLMAFYEHKIFIQGIMWGINSFDQWGVELGKELISQIGPMLEDGSAESAENSSTKGLVNAVHAMNKNS